MDLSYPAPPLADGAVALRAWSAADVACVQAASTDPLIRRGTTVPAVATEAEALGFILRQLGRERSGEGLSLAIVEAGAAVGLVYFGERPEPAVVSLGYWLVPAARGRGLGAHAIRLACGWALGAAGAARVEAWVEPGNAASAATLTRAGFQHEGLLRSFLVLGGERADVRVYSRIRADG